MDWAFCFSRVLEDHNILMFNNLITFDQSNSKFTFNLQTIPKFVEWSCWTFFISQWQQNDGWSRSPSHFVTHPHQNKVLLFISTVLYCFLRLQDILWHHVFVGMTDDLSGDVGGRWGMAFVVWESPFAHSCWHYLLFLDFFFLDLSGNCSVSKDKLQWRLFF